VARILLGDCALFDMLIQSAFSLRPAFCRPFLIAVLSGTLALTAAANTKGDIGAPQPAGKTVQQGSLWMVTGGGADFSGSADQFHFASSPFSGDCTMSAKIFSVGDESAHEWAKAALMVRADDSVGSPHASVAMGHGGIPVFLIRSTPRGNTRSERAPKMSFPIYLRLIRQRDDFTASYSQDGKTWVQIGKTATVPMKPECLAGMAVTSHTNGMACTAAFSDYVLKRWLP
jgi:regulation of enolase protein 1 (concanavalin A-like superfamily)